MPLAPSAAALMLNWSERCLKSNAPLSSMLPSFVDEPVIETCPENRALPALRSAWLAWAMRSRSLPLPLAAASGAATASAPVRANASIGMRAVRRSMVGMVGLLEESGGSA